MIVVKVEKGSCHDRGSHRDPKCDSESGRAQNEVQDLATIKRVDGKQVQERPENTDPIEPMEKMQEIWVQIPIRILKEQSQRSNGSCQGQLQKRAGRSDPQALLTGHRWSVENGNASECVQDDLAPSSEATGGGGMPKLMNQNRKKPCRHEQCHRDDLRCRSRANRSTKQSHCHPEKRLHCDWNPKNSKTNHLQFQYPRVIDGARKAAGTVNELDEQVLDGRSGRT